MSDDKSVEELAKEYANAAVTFSKAAEKSNQEAAKSAAIVARFSKAIADLDATDSPQGKATTETKGKHIHAYLDDYDYYTGKTSDINRSLALAGVAIIWIFRNPESSQALFPETLLIPLWFLVISLILDLLQYFLGAMLWGIFYEYKYHLWKRKKTITDEMAKDIEAPNILSVPLIVIFFAKIVSMVFAYYKLFFFLQDKINLL